MSSTCRTTSYEPCRTCPTGNVDCWRSPAQLPALVRTPGRQFGVYVHVPFCATRCGYCDFNTYTPGELDGASPDGWLAAEPRFADAGEHRAAYADYLLTRLAPPRDFVEEAAHARSLSV